MLNSLGWFELELWLFAFQKESPPFWHLPMNFRKKRIQQKLRNEYKQFKSLDRSRSNINCWPISSYSVSNFRISVFLRQVLFRNSNLKRWLKTFMWAVVPIDIFLFRNWWFCHWTRRTMWLHSAKKPKVSSKLSENELVVICHRYFPPPDKINTQHWTNYATYHHNLISRTPIHSQHEIVE